jgi:hypothetical protein
MVPVKVALKGGLFMSDLAFDTGDADDHPLGRAVVGVLAHNEAPTIERCLRAILAERHESVAVQSVLVVASGCTDGTEDIVRKIVAEDPRVRLVVEPQRSGKAGAINILLRESKDPIIVMLGGDIVFTPGSLVRLVEPFTDPSVGMTGARPIPTNTRRGILGTTVNILWDLHQELAIHKPKMGEAVAFRRVIESINQRTLADEGTIEHLMTARGLKLRYVPTAIVRNHGPETLSDFIAQRQRTHRGQLALASETGYRVSSLSLRALLSVTWRYWRAGRASAHQMAIAAVMEGMARSLARLSRLSSRQDVGLWQPIASSKHVLKSGHSLRVYHEGLQTIRLGRAHPGSWLAARRSSMQAIAVKRLVRVEDRVSGQWGQIVVTLRGDDDAARVLLVRLQVALPDLVQFSEAADPSVPVPDVVLRPAD